MVGQIQVQCSTGGIIGFHAEADNKKAVQFVFGFHGRFFLAMLSLHFSGRDREAGSGGFDALKDVPVLWRTNCLLNCC
jgi:hypothetical protein